MEGIDTPALEKVIREYFADYFDEMKFYFTDILGNPVFCFRGWRNGNVFNTNNLDTFIWHLANTNGEIYHWLENIKGDFVRSEQTVILEKHGK